MDSSKSELVYDLVLGRLTEETFVERYGIDLRARPDAVLELLEEAQAEASADQVECAMILAHRFGLSCRWAPIFCDLLDADWHHSHEDIVDALQNIRVPDTVACLHRAAVANHAYRDYDDYSGLAIKCIWALHDIATPAAIESLRALAASDTIGVRGQDAARERLAALSDKETRRPEPYRLERDKTLRPD